MALVVCAIGLLGVACGRVATSHYGAAAIVLAVALPVLAFLVARPFASYVLVLALLGSVISYTALPRVTLPGHPPITIGEVLLGVTVAGTLWRRPWRTWPAPIRTFGLLLLAMLIVALVPAVTLAAQGHNQAREAILGYSDLLFVGAALTLALELRGRFWWPVVNSAILLSALVAILSLLAAASGSIDSYLSQVSVNSVLAVTGATSRIRLPGLFLVYAMTIPTLVTVLLIKDRWRWLRAAALLLMIAAVAVSLNRNMYLGGAAGLLVTLLIGGPRLRYRFVVVGAIVAVSAVLVLPATLSPAVTSEVATRARSALSPQVFTSNSLETRGQEFAHAFVSISKHPVTGVGWYQFYGDYVSPNNPRYYVENWYLDLATDMGIPVAILFVVLSLTVAGFGVRSARRASSALDRAMVAGGLGSLIGLLLSSVVGTYLQDPNSMTAFGFTCGLVLAAGVRASPLRTAAAPDPGPAATLSGS
jgi:hypothetical protein